MITTGNVSGINTGYEQSLKKTAPQGPVDKRG